MIIAEQLSRILATYHMKNNDDDNRLFENVMSIKVNNYIFVKLGNFLHQVRHFPSTFLKIRACFYEYNRTLKLMNKKRLESAYESNK